MYKKWIGIGLVCAILAMGIEVYLVSQLWTEKNTCNILVLKRDAPRGTILDEKDLMKMEVDESQVVRGSLKEGTKLLKMKLTRDVTAGKILSEKDFQENNQSQLVESIVVKLDYEQGHSGNLVEGEEINTLCYHQGNVSMIEGLVVRKVEKDLINLGEASYYITLSGRAELLETLVLAKREGSIHILKKTTVHN